MIGDIMLRGTWKAALVLIGVGAMAPAGYAAELSGTLAKVKQSGSISLGVRETSVPFNYQDDKQ